MTVRFGNNRLGFYSERLLLIPIRFRVNLIHFLSYSCSDFAFR